MSDTPHDTEDSVDVYRPKHILSGRNLPSLAAIGAAVACTVGVFAYTGGWLTPHRLSPAEVVDQFERTNGIHLGFRRNHPKGVCFSGRFDSDGSGAQISKAALFAPGTTPLFGRFAIASGQPYLPDTAKSVRSMALNFALANGETWRMGLNDIPVFTVASTQDLYDQLKAAIPDPKTGKPDPVKLAAFMASHPESAAATAVVKAAPHASGFADTTYNSLNAFLFTDARSHTTPVRWAMVAEDPFVVAKPDPAQAQQPNYQFDDLLARIRNGPIRFRFVVTMANPGDQTRDPTRAWPADRRKVTVGVLTIDRLEDEMHGPCRDITFDPLVLPAGVKGSDDPILSARSAVYAASYRRRASESAPMPAVRFPAETQGAR
ncbi:catalase family peroxidase [Sphingomonas oryzagri]